MRYCKIRILVVAVLLLCCGIGFASSDNYFNVTQANRTLNKLSLQLANQNVTVKDLKHAVNVLTKLQVQAKLYINNAQGRLDAINQFWKESKGDLKDQAELTEAQKYLKDKAKQLTNRRSASRLFLLRSNEIVNTFRKTAQQLAAKKLLEVKPDFLQQMINSVGLTKKVVSQFNKKLFLTRSGLTALNIFNSIVLGVLLLCVILIGLMIKYFVRKAMQIKVAENFSEKLRSILLYIADKYSTYFLVFLALAVFATVINNLPEQLTYLSWISYGLVAYIVSLIVICFLFYPFRAHSSITGISEDIARSLITRLKVLLDLLLISFIIYVLWQGQSLPSGVIALVRTIFITLLAINLVSISWLINRIPALFTEHQGLQFFINFVLTCSLAAILIAEWLGYQVLVTFVLQGIVLTLISVFVAWVLNKIVAAIMQNILKSGEG
jgi:hypothetical protein